MYVIQKLNDNILDEVVVRCRCDCGFGIFTIYLSDFSQVYFNHYECGHRSRDSRLRCNYTTFIDFVTRLKNVAPDNAVVLPMEDGEALVIQYEELRNEYILYVVHRLSQLYHHKAHCSYELYMSSSQFDEFYRALHRMNKKLLDKMQEKAKKIFGSGEIKVDF